MIMRNQSLHVLRRPLYLELFLCYNKYAFGESSYFFPLVFSWKASDDGGSMNDVHICLSLFRASDRQLPLSVKSSFMLSIHIFCCLPRLLFPVIFVCSTLIGVFALSIPPKPFQFVLLYCVVLCLSLSFLVAIAFLFHVFLFCLSLRFVRVKSFLPLYTVSQKSRPLLFSR